MIIYDTMSTPIADTSVHSIRFDTRHTYSRTHPKEVRSGTLNGTKWHPYRYLNRYLETTSDWCRFGQSDLRSWNRTSGHREMSKFHEIIEKRRNRGQNPESSRIVVKTANLTSKRRIWHLNRRFQDHRWGEAEKGRNSAFFPMFRA